MANLRTMLRTCWDDGWRDHFGVEQGLNRELYFPRLLRTESVVNRDSLGHGDIWSFRIGIYPATQARPNTRGGLRSCVVHAFITSTEVALDVDAVQGGDSGDARGGKRDPYVAKVWNRCC